MTGPTSEHYRLTLVMIQFLIEILNHFSTSLSIVESAILGDLLAFVIQSLTSHSSQNLVKWLMLTIWIHYFLGASVGHLVSPEIQIW